MPARRSHIAMIGIPIVSHVLPSLAIVRELVARGHRVTYANDPFVAHRVEASGAELVPCTSTLPVADNDWPADPVAAASLFLDDAVQALPQLRAAYDDDPADLYLYDIGAYAGRALAEAQGRGNLKLGNRCGTFGPVVLLGEDLVRGPEIGFRRILTACRALILTAQARPANL